MSHRATALAALTVIAGLAAGCASGSSSSLSAPASSASAASPAEPGEGSPGTLAPGQPALAGGSVQPTVNGFPYNVGPASAPTLAASYTEAGVAGLPGTVQDAPPGSDFVLFWVKLTNPTADRQAPFLADETGQIPYAFIGVGVPAAEGSKFCTSGVSGAGVALADGYCGYLTSLTSETAEPDSNEIPPGGSIALQLAAGPVPAGAPLQDVHLFVRPCTIGPNEPDCPANSNILEIPRASS